MTTSIKDYKGLTRTSLELPSGAVFEVKRPGPEVTIKAGRLPSNLFGRMAEAIKGKDGSPVAKGMEVFQNMTDGEIVAFKGYADILVASAVVSPRMTAGESTEEALSVNDLDQVDFWHLFAWANSGGKTLPIQVKGGGEVSIDDLETFHDDGGVPGDGAYIEGDEQAALAVPGNQ